MMFPDQSSGQTVTQETFAECQAHARHPCSSDQDKILTFLERIPSENESRVSVELNSATLPSGLSATADKCVVSAGSVTPFPQLATAG